MLNYFAQFWTQFQIFTFRSCSWSNVKSLTGTSMSSRGVLSFFCPKELERITSGNLNNTKHFRVQQLQQALSVPSWWICSTSDHGKWWEQHPWRGGHQTRHRLHPVRPEVRRRSGLNIGSLLHWAVLVGTSLRLNKPLRSRSDSCFTVWAALQWTIFVKGKYKFVLTCLAALLNEATVFSLILWCL